MFSPSQADVRRFFCSIHAKSQATESMDSMETLAALWIKEHPEYHNQLSNLDAALMEMTQVDESKPNAFLHLSMHLSISEQCSIDQPRGIRQAIELLSHNRSSLHLAHHEAMDCLGQMIWESQQAGRPPDGNTYIECVQRHATRD